MLENMFLLFLLFSKQLGIKCGGVLGYGSVFQCEVELFIKYSFVFSVSTEQRN